MGTRSGSIDPSIVLHVQQRRGMTAEQVETALNHESGLLGVSNISGDMRQILDAVRAGHQQAQLALAVYTHRVRQAIGALAVTLGGVDALVFTAGVTIAMVLGFGTAPAFWSARVDLESAIRTGGSRGTTGRGRLRGALVVAELALTVVLVVGAGLLLRSYANVLAVDPGFDPRRLLLAETALPPLKYADTAARSAFIASILPWLSFWIVRPE